MRISHWTAPDASFTSNVEIVAMSSSQAGQFKCHVTELPPSFWPAALRNEMNANNINQLAQATVTGAMPFPEIVGKLIAEGVDYYHVDYANLQFHFYGKDGGVIVAPLPLEMRQPIVPIFDGEALRAAIMDSQQNGQTFKAFSRRAVEAGVAGYFAFLSGKRVTYFGRQGDQHVEWFPGAKPTEA